MYRIVASRSTCYYSENQIFCFLKSPDNFSRDNIAGLHGSNVVVIKCPPPPLNSDRVNWSYKIWPCLHQPRKHFQMKHFCIQLGLWRSKLKISDFIKCSGLDFPIITKVSKVFGLPSSALSILLDKNYIGSRWLLTQATDTQRELFFKNLKFLGLGRQIGPKIYEAFVLFLAKL